MFNEVGHIFQTLFVNVAHDLVKGVIDRAIARSFLMPRSKTILNVFALALERHVDDGGDATPRCCVGASFKSVGCFNRAHGKFHMCMHVDAARNDVLACCIDDLVGNNAECGCLPWLKNSLNGFTIDEHIACIAATRAHNGAVRDEDACHM